VRREQSAQPGVLLRERLRSLDDGALYHELATQLGVFLGQARLAREICGDRIPRLDGDQRGALQRGDDDAGGDPDVLQVAVTGVGEQHGEGEQTEEDEAGEGTGAAPEERRRVGRQCRHRIRRFPVNPCGRRLPPGKGVRLK
jgi:hypothetical protein